MTLCVIDDSVFSVLRSTRTCWYLFRDEAFDSVVCRTFHQLSTISSLIANIDFEPTNTGVPLQRKHSTATLKVLEQRSPIVGSLLSHDTLGGFSSATENIVVSVVEENNFSPVVRLNSGTVSFSRHGASRSPRGKLATW